MCRDRNKSSLVHCKTSLSLSLPLPLPPLSPSLLPLPLPPLSLSLPLPPLSPSLPPLPPSLLSLGRDGRPVLCWTSMRPNTGPRVLTIGQQDDLHGDQGKWAGHNFAMVLVSNCEQVSFQIQVTVLFQITCKEKTV